MTEPLKTLYLHQPNWYTIDTTKLKTVTDVVELLTALDMKVSEDYAKFDEVKHLLHIPEEPKTLEEIQKEFEDKIDERIKSIKIKFEVLQNRAERNYDLKFDRIIGNFEYAQKNGFFPISLATSGTIGLDGSYLVAGTNSIQWSTHPSFVIKQGNKHQGYYTFGNGKYFKYYMPNKPNMIVRFFMKTCLGFWWVDEE